MHQKILAILLSVLLLTSCSASLNTDNLLSPPKLTADQTKLYSALESAVGTGSFKLKYPRRGTYLSAFILEDLDNDDVSEAIAFYELTVAGLSSTWMSILVQEDDKWRSAVQIPAPESEIDFIDFSRVTQLERQNIIVGWSASKREDMTASVYLFNNSQVSTMFTEPYNEFLSVDVDQNGLEELLFFTKNSSKPAAIRLAKFRASKISIVGEVMLPTSTESFANVGYGTLTKGLNGVFADIHLDNGMITTIIATINRSTLDELYPEDLGLFTSFERKPPTLSFGDFNQDGFYDIPQNEVLPGYNSSSEIDKLYLTKFYSIMDGALLPTTYAIVNHKAGYMLKVPPIWENTVTVQIQADANEWRFVVYDTSIASSELELLRIKAVGPGDYVDKFDTTNYKSLCIKGKTNYLAYIPPQIIEELSITYEELEKMFTLL